jgi:hypothetical protein
VHPADLNDFTASSVRHGHFPTLKSFRKAS